MEKIYEWKRCKYYSKHFQTIKQYIGCLYDIEGCSSGGLLHILLDDDNFDDDSILFCLRECLLHPEREESKIGKIICEEYLQLSMPERRLLTQPYISSFQCLCHDGNCDTCYVQNGIEER